MGVLDYRTPNTSERPWWPTSPWVEAAGCLLGVVLSFLVLISVLILGVFLMAMTPRMLR